MREARPPTAAKDRSPAPVRWRSSGPCATSSTTPLFTAAAPACRWGRDEDAAIVTIADDGPGIPEELIGRAFEPFFRVDPGRRQFKPGAGLGMAIAKEIVDQAGGAITVANRNGGGLDQTIRLPLAHDVA